MEWYKEEIGKCTYREFTTGFYFGKPGADAQIYDSNTYVKNYTYLGTVEESEAAGSESSRRISSLWEKPLRS